MPIDRLFLPKWLLPLLVLGLTWCATLRILWTDWRIDPQYSYGVLVPLLVIGLLLKRWEDKPARSTLDSGENHTAAVLCCLSGLLLALTIPMSVANPDWRPLGLVASCAAVTITLAVVAWDGGVAWMRHFAFPICFFLIAVPWTRNVEQAVMLRLMRWNASTTLEILHWAGYEAMCQGNLIVLPSGVLDIEEACSGIRSLQSGLMAALFMGEIYRLIPSRRFLLVIVAILSAVVGNVARNALLALIASSQGIGAVSAWHDRAGILVLLITFGTIFGCAYFWRMKARNPLAQEQSAPREAATKAEGKGSGWCLAAVALLLSSSLVLTEIWFVSHEQGDRGRWGWSLRRREGVQGVTGVPLSPATLRLLFYPTGFSEKWITSEGKRGQMFFFEWPAGRTAVQAVAMHNPEACLSSVGMYLLSSLAPVNCELGSGKIPFRSWVFEEHGRLVYVFQALIEKGAESGINPDAPEDSPSGRLRSLLTARRNKGQRMVEVALWDCPDEISAKKELLRTLQEASGGYGMIPAKP